MYFKKKTLLLTILFIALCIVARYIRFEVFDKFSLVDLLAIDKGFKPESLIYIDDSFIYEEFLLQGGKLFFFNNGVLLEIMLFIPRFLSGGNNKVALIYILIINFYIVFQLYKLLGGRSLFLDLLVLPYLASITISLNKEIYTIFTLVILSPFAFQKGFYKIISVSMGETFFNLIRLGVGFLSISAVFVGRSRLPLLVISIYLLIFVFQLIFDGRFQIKNTLNKNIFKYLVIVVLGFLFIDNFYDVNFVLNKITQDINEFSENISLASSNLLRTTISLPYGIMAPFPFSFLNNPVFGPLANYHIINYYFLSIVSFIRIQNMYKSFKSYQSFSIFLFYNKYLFSLLICSIIFVSKGDEVTRQVITVTFPISHLLANSFSETNNLIKNYY